MTGHERLDRELATAFDLARAALVDKLAKLTPGEATRVARIVKLLVGRGLHPTIDRMRRLELARILAAVATRVDGEAPDPDLVEQLERLVLLAWPLKPDTAPAAAAAATPAPRSRRLMRSNHLRVT